MTRAFLLLLRGEPQEALLTECEFEKLITAQSVGPLILNYVFATGFKSAFSLALTSKRLWVILAGSVNYFDFYAGRLQNLGPSGVFVSVTPEFTLQEMMATRLTDPYGFKAATPFTDWHNAAITREEDAVNTLFMVRQRLRAEAKKSKNGPQQPIPAFLDAIFNQSTLRAILALKDIDAIFKANQFVSLPADSIFEPQMIYAATRLQLLLIQIYNQRNNIQVLHLHKTPFLDRRVLAIVLRACPKIIMLGVYNCPLIHFGDLVPILDLIYEINEERRLKNMPLIAGFDFFPSFHPGLTVPQAQYPIYGLAPDSMDLDIVQRGVYAILLKGYLKSRHMRLKLLFEPGRALKAFLFRLPNPPLSMATFFDGLYRYLDGEASLVQRRQALFDLTKPIRLGLEQNLDDETWSQEEMGRYLPFCSSCGYEMLYELFPVGTRRVYPQRRICAACSLQDLLDRQPHDMRDWKIGMLAKIMPDWDGKVFNRDAPIGHQTSPGSDLMHLQTTAASREEVSPLHVGPDGQLAATRHVIQLLRDNKYTTDSLQNLPSLHDLVQDHAAFDGRWAELFNRCNEADIYIRARRRLLDETKRSDPDKPLSKAPRDCNGEIWHRPKHAREVQSYNYLSAAQFHAASEFKGW
ncbi:hypothetical protein LMH87_006126 [Akanthomyces muscarius]|uniref:Uncharacterized protein n=1 Tax=Akanthomyces muscarius TaxID=2231603 RepID=A0A9W8QNY5_AKAMU|nr:hypothetical protein LMH87_006126 [Akanthomyces muscarius]KAJ4164450.1 hypothetical protein LMH87_006126 [Akanthomyces muscarius]